jgi:hypothetical protein
MQICVGRTVRQDPSESSTVAEPLLVTYSLPANFNTEGLRDMPFFGPITASRIVPPDEGHAKGTGVGQENAPQGNGKQQITPVLRGRDLGISLKGQTDVTPPHTQLPVSADIYTDIRISTVSIIYYNKTGQGHVFERSLLAWFPLVELRGNYLLNGENGTMIGPLDKLPDSMMPTLDRIETDKRFCTG